LSQIALAEAIDRWVDAGSAFVTESESRVTVTDLAASTAADLRARCVGLAWPHALLDSAGNAWPDAENPDPDFGPFRLTIEKPAAPQGALRLLTDNAFRRWLSRGHEALQWQIARLGQPLVTQKRAFLPWDAVCEASPSVVTKNPRNLVREFGTERQVPDDVRPWLTAGLTPTQIADSTIQVWMVAATRALVLCLPDELDSDTGALKFRGPPRLTLPPLADGDALPPASFGKLQEALHWVFENERESEMRHILLANEIARSGSSPAPGGSIDFLSAHLSGALESAQIAYQMALADTGRDTLKVLTELRKAITEETAKLSDQTRQLATSVAGALATGVGLVAARIAANASAEAVAAIMLVAAIYVASVIVSGIQFIVLQRQLRTQWHPRLYRFLPAGEYKRMVTQPARRAECAFVWTAWLGGIAVFLLTVICAWPLTHRGRSTAEKAPKPVAARVITEKPTPPHLPARTPAAAPTKQPN
jgi:hypothetical protein